MGSIQENVDKATLEESRALARLLFAVHKQDRDDLLSITEMSKKISIFSLFATVTAVCLTAIVIKGGGRD